MQTEKITEKWGQLILPSSTTRISELNLGEIISLLEKNGVLLFRGFDINSENITTFTNLFTERYARPANRRYSSEQKIARNADYCKNSDIGTDIPLHSESSFAPVWPEFLSFYCKIPPIVGGQTTLCDGINIWNSLSSSIKQFFLGQPLRYELEIDVPPNLKKRPGKGKQPWIFSKPGVSGYLDWDKHLISLKLLRYAVNDSRIANNLCFSNHLLARLEDETQIKKIRMANGDKISEDLISEVKETCEGLTYAHTWQKDDVILLDNIRFMHGRRYFEKKDPRQILLIEIERASFGYGSTTRTQIKS